ncbi:MAG: hypothetical protein FD145_661 [Candidatus Saganbacteria bacterium]|uniref:Uncharacterized protein n=1 Tax=Candidatus Saganbacteria bacterium TaxID=2575572 RepID=A0A833L1G1_UNCSA|nr:MAG: hypothetical protein FD145_661 [Candidatus Saganbacteria bacterium]
MCLEIARIVRKLQPFFPFANYGYAGAIRQGRLQVEEIGGAPRLSIISPPITYPSSTLPSFYSCDTASEILLHEARWRGLIAQKIEVNFPYISSAGNQEEIMHKLVVVREEGNTYLVGLTPFDVLFGIYPFKERAGDFLPRVSSSLEEPRTLVMRENPSWSLEEFNFQMMTLQTRFLDGCNTALLTADLGIGRMKGALVIACVNRMFRFNGTLAVEGESDFFLSLPINQLSCIIEKMRFFNQDPLSSLLFLSENNLSRNVMGFSDGLAERATQSLAFDSWPITAQVLYKLPIEQIMQMLF